MLSRVISDAFPQQAKDDKVAMLRMNTRSSQFNHLRAKRLESLELELLRAVIAAIRRRVVPGLQSVCADDIGLSLIHISEPTRLLSISYAVFCLKKKKK